MVYLFCCITDNMFIKGFVFLVYSSVQMFYAVMILWHELLTVISEIPLCLLGYLKWKKICLTQFTVVVFLIFLSNSQSYIVLIQTRTSIY